MSNRKNRWLLLSKYLISVAVLAACFWKVGVVETISIIPDLNISYLLFIVLFLIPLTWFFRIYKWFILAESVSPENTLKRIVRPYLFGYLCGIVTPGRIGEFARISELEGKKTSLTIQVTIDRMLDLLSVVYLAIFTGSFILYKSFLMSFINSTIFLFLLWLFSRSTRFLTLILLKKSKSNPVEIQTITNSLDTSLIVKVFSMSVISYILGTVQCYLFVNSFNHSNPLLLLIIPIVMLHNIIPISIGGFGIREGIFLILTKDLPIPPEVIINSSILWTSINILIVAIVYVLIVFVQKKSDGNYRTT